MQPLTSPEILVIPEKVLSRLRSTYPTLPEAEQRVADYILRTPHDIIHSPVHVLAQNIGVSHATIVRCCQSIGYRGLRELKIALASETATALPQAREDVLPTDSVRDMIHKVLLWDIQAIGDTLGILEAEAVENTVKAMLAAKRIEFYGIGSSIPIVIDAYYRFLRIGCTVGHAVDPYIMLASSSQLGAGDVAFGISHSGRSPETLHALRTAYESGATCVVLSSHANTPMSEYAHIQLLTAARETVFRTESAASRIAHLSVIDALYVAVSMSRAAQASAAMEKHRIAMNARKDA